MTSLKIKGQVLTPSSGEEYIKAIQRHSDFSVLHPKYVAFPVVFEDIPQIIQFATSQSLELTVKGGGASTSTWASTEGGLVIDLGRLKAVHVSGDKKTLTVQGGAVWGDVYEACKEAEIDVVGAPYWFIGVGGYLLGAGFSHMTGEHGFAIDSLLGATVVLADGRIVKTSATEEPDLFWAIRGGFNQFGVVVEFILKAYPPQGPFCIGTLVYEGNEVSNVVNAFQEWKKTFKNTEHLVMTFVRPPPHFKPLIIITSSVTHGGDAVKTLAPIRNGAAKLHLDKVDVWQDMLAFSHTMDAQILGGSRRIAIRGALITDSWPDLILDVWNRWCKFTEDDGVKQTVVLWEATRMDKLASVGPTDTAVHCRHKDQYWMVVNGRSSSPASDDAVISFVSSTAEYVRRVDTEKSGKDLGVFVNLSRGNEDKIEDVFGVNLPRLRKLKAKYDPKKIWCKGYVIEPDFS